jgi:AhpD family alkylhydroperoxidase
MNTFKKRTFTLPLLAASAAAALRQFHVAVRGLRRPATSRALQEEVMLAVTSVNDCRYCDWVHTGLALEEGVNLAALHGALTGEGARLSEREAAAVFYAQHFAETQRQPLPQARARLHAHFSPAEVREIEAFIDLIWFANLSGNSADAVLARLRGQAVPEGHLLAELVSAALAAPVLAAIALRGAKNTGRPLAAL